MKEYGFVKFVLRSVIKVHLLLVIVFFVFAPTVVLALTANTIGEFGQVVVMEVTGDYNVDLPDGSSNALARAEVAREFYRLHPDRYDFLIIVSNFDFQLPNAAIAYYQPVQNDVQGIGAALMDNSAIYGSGKLQGTIDLGNLAHLAVDPTNPRFADTMGTLSHELLHRWAAFVRYKKIDGLIGTDLLGTDGTHWSYLLDTGSSLEYGNNWRDNGDGTFTAGMNRRYFSPLDLYLMGFVGKDTVKPMLLIENPAIDPDRPPEQGVTINGLARYVSIDDIIDVEGERVPGVAGSQKSFRVACIFITRPDTFSGNEIYDIDNIVQAWPLWFSALTNGIGKITVDSGLSAILPVNPGPQPPAVDPRTAPPEILDGVAWLIDHQQVDGSWGDSLFTRERDTAASIGSLQFFPGARQSIERAGQWLGDTSSANLDYLARSIESFIPLGKDIGSRVSEIIVRRNQDGGWGAVTGYLSNPSDTALALKALAMAVYSDNAFLKTSIDYLKQTQNQDGGWGTNLHSDILATANVLAAFSSFRRDFQLDTPIQRALTWLEAKQNPDGGFGNSPSTIYSTAVVLGTFKQLGISSSTIQSALDYMLAEQLADGSWQQSAFQTAMAVNALWTGMREADLEVNTSGFTCTPLTITALPTVMTCNVKVLNSGMTDVPLATLGIYDSAVSPANLVGKQDIVVAGQSTTTISFTFTITGAGNHRLFAVVDIGNQVKEASETNNTALRIIYPEFTFDFEVSDQEFNVSPLQTDLYNPVVVSAKIRNNGTADAMNVAVRLSVKDGVVERQIATTYVNIPAGKAMQYEQTWMPEVAGDNLTLRLSVDPANALPELSEVNNSASRIVTVNLSGNPNLALRYEDISINPDPAHDAGTSIITALVANKGYSDASDLAVAFYEGVPESGGVLLGSSIIPLVTAGQSAPAVFAWRDINGPGRKIVTVVVDPEYHIAETNENDNMAFVEIDVLTLPDFIITDTVISFSPEAPRAGESIVIQVLVRNFGEQPGINVPVAFYDGTTLHGYANLDLVNGLSQATVQYIYDPAGQTGLVQLKVVVDPENTVKEQKKNNNTAARSFGIQNANLWLTERYFSPNGDGVKDTTQFGFRLQTPQTVKVVVVNKNNETVREFNGSGFVNILGTAAVWDGRDTRGRIVDDGQYRIQVMTDTGRALADLPVVVDNNRSPLLDAIETEEYLFRKNIGGVLGSYGYWGIASSSDSRRIWHSFENRWKWLPDDSAIIIHVPGELESAPEYTTGLYSMTPLGGGITRLVPTAWSEDSDPVIGYRFKKNGSDVFDFNCDIANPGFAMNSDGRSLVFILEKYNKQSGLIEQNQLWIMDRFGQNLKLLASYDTTVAGLTEITDIFWSPDSKHLVFKTFDSSTARYFLHILSENGNEQTLVEMHMPAGVGHDQPIAWSPDNSRFAFISNKYVVVSDNYGATKQIHPLQNNYAFIEWFDENKLLIRDQYGSSYYQDIWIVSVNDDADPVLIAEQVVGNMNYDDGPQCLPVHLQDGKLNSWPVNNIPLTKEGLFQFYDDNRNDYDKGDYRTGHMVCNKFGECNDVIGQNAWHYRIAGFSPDSKKFVIAPLTGNINVFDPSTKQTDFYIMDDGDCWGCLEDVPADLPPAIHRVPLIENSDHSIFIYPWRWDWFDNNNMLMAAHESNYLAGYHYDGAGAFNIYTGELKYLPEDWTDRELLLSPGGRYITTYFENDSQLNSDDTSWVIGSVLNLTAALEVTVREAGVQLKGIAADLNFQKYTLEYADLKKPSEWRLIMPPSEKPVVDKPFGEWIPPHGGTFYVRLTVTDKAGNSTWDRRRISWKSDEVPLSVVDIYKSGELFSPNNDGVQDSVALHYTVNVPVHFDVNLYNHSGVLLKTFKQNHALAGEYELVWDGRDDTGAVVPDGSYSLRLFDYEFIFEVDNTPPKVFLEFQPMHGADNYHQIAVLLDGLAMDNNLKEWSIEHADSWNPAAWYMYHGGKSALVETNDHGVIMLDKNGNPLPGNIVSFFPGEVTSSFEFMQNGPFRIVALDWAGNSSVYEDAFNEEVLVLRTWDNNGLIFFRTASGEFQSENSLPAEYIHRGVHALQITETIISQIVSLTVQYRINMEWRDSQVLHEPSSGEIRIDWDSSALNPEEIAAVRIKAVDTQGIVYYSNVVPVGTPVFILSSGCTNGGVIESIGFEISLFEDLVSLQWQVMSRDDSRYPEWTDLQDVDLSTGYPTNFSVSNIEFSSPNTYQFRAIGVDQSGRQYVTNSISFPLGKCLTGSSPNNSSFSVCLGISHSTPGACNTLSSGKSNITLNIEGNYQLTPKTVSYFLVTGDEQKLLRQFDYRSQGVGSVTLDTNVLAEGKYQVRAVVLFADGNSSAYQAELIVDRTLPEARIDNPAVFAAMCGHVDIEGAVNDDNSIQSWALSYSISKERGGVIDFEPHDIRVGKSCELSSTPSKSGSLGTWQVSNLPSPRYDVQLSVSDIVGNTSCVVVPAVNDTIVTVTAAADLAIFSPNRDGQFDDLTITYGVDEFAVVDISVAGISVADRSLVGKEKENFNIISGVTINAGTRSIIWDGKNEKGDVVPDGLYKIRVSAYDMCGNFDYREITVEIDNTPPIVQIISPSSADPLGSVVAVLGTAAEDEYSVNEYSYNGHLIAEYSDPGHFKEYELTVASSDDPETKLMRLEQSEFSIKNEILGSWYTSGLPVGSYELRLTARDTVGNVGSTTVTMIKYPRIELINDLRLNPGIVSPNADGHQDFTEIQYNLTETANIVLSLQGATDPAITLDSAAAVAAGPHTYNWNGLDSKGQVFPDGPYKVKLTAVQAINPVIAQEESITIIVDTTPPGISITQPAVNAYLPGWLAVHGSLIDANLREYTIEVSGNGISLPIDHGHQNRTDYTFGNETNLADGVYNLMISSTDGGSNTMQTEIPFTVDQTPPEAAFTAPEDGVLVGGTLKEVSMAAEIVETNLQSYSILRGSGQDPEQWTEIVSGSELPTDNILGILVVGPGSGLIDTDYTLKLVVIDRAGWQTEDRRLITVDNTPPALAISSPVAGGYIKQPFQITGSIHDEHLEEFSLAMAQGVCGVAGEWSVLRQGTKNIDGILSAMAVLPADGAYCLRLAATDAVGNTSEVMYGITVDTLPPAPPLLNAGKENDRNVRLSWSNNNEPDLVGFDIYRNSQKINSQFVSGYEYLDVDLPEQEFEYFIKAIDRAGWASAPSNKVSLRIDTSPPVAGIILPMEGAVIGNYTDITGTAFSKDDFKEYRLSTGLGSAPVTWNILRTSPVPIQGGLLGRWDLMAVSDGTYTIKLEAEDLSGNQSTATVQVIVDNTPPLAPVLLSAVPAGSTVELVWQANLESDLAGYLLYRNGRLVNSSGTVIGDLTPYLIKSTRYSDAEVPDGTISYYLMAVDKALNESAISNVLTVELDNHPPRATLVSPANNTRFEQPLIVRAETTDFDIADVLFQYRSASDTNWLDIESIAVQPFVVLFDPVKLGLSYGTSYRLRAVATDRNSKTDAAPMEITVIYTDLTPPAIPTGLSARINGGFVTLNWHANSETDLAGYNVYRDTVANPLNGTLLAVPGMTYPGDSSGLTIGIYTFHVKAKDTYGNESPGAQVVAEVFAPVLTQPQQSMVNQPELQLNGTTLANSTVELFRAGQSGPLLIGTVHSGGDGAFSLNLLLDPGLNTFSAVATDPAGNISRVSNTVTVQYDAIPSTPTGLTAVVNGYDVLLSWNANPEPDLAGYNLYRNGLLWNVPTLVAAGSAANASDLFQDAGNAIDSDSGTSWETYYYFGGFPGVWWEMLLPTPQWLNRLEIEWGGNELATLAAGKQYTISAWRDNSWVILVTVENNQRKINTHVFNSPIFTNRIRINISKTTYSETLDHVELAEVRFYQKPYITSTAVTDSGLADGEYEYQVSAVDKIGSESPLSATVKAVVGDIVLPQAPQGLVAQVNGSDVLLSWSPNSEPDLAGYNIYRFTEQEWRLIGTVLAIELAYSNLGLVNGPYRYRITAFDAVANESPPSSEATARVTVNLPQAPTGLTITSPLEGGALLACWNAPATGALGYNLYRNLISGGPYGRANSVPITTTCYRDAGLMNGVRYFYVVVALDLPGNESGYSNEASSIPLDRQPPVAPILVWPTNSNGMPYVSRSDHATLFGKAEPGTIVDLFNNGDYMASAFASAYADRQTIPLSEISLVSDFDVSSDGGTVIYSARQDSSLFDYYFWQKDLRTGESSIIMPEVEGGWWPLLSSDGAKLVYQYSDSSRNYRVGVHDLKSGVSTPLTAGLNVEEWEPSWSPDSRKVVFGGDRGSGFYEIWLHDLETGMTTQITNGVNGGYPEFSNNGDMVAYVDYNAPTTADTTLFVVDIDGGTPKLVDSALTWPNWFPNAEWSPVDNRLAFVSSRDGNPDIYIYDVDSGETRRLTDTQEAELDIVWSPDGSELGFIIDTANGSEIRAVSIDGGDSRVLGRYDNLSMWYIRWKPTGIYFVANQDLHWLPLPGFVTFKDIPLQAGANVFNATASDDADNISLSSNQVVITLDPALLPDIEALAEDISFYPAAPITGDQVVVLAAIRNNTDVPAENVLVELYVSNAKGRSLVGTETVPYLQPHSEEWLGFYWNSSGLTGKNAFEFLADPENAIIEAKEDNNSAREKLLVLSGEGLAMATSLDSGQYGYGEYVMVDLLINNSGPAQAGLLSVRIEDESGQMVATLHNAEIQAPYGGDLAYQYLWNTKTVFAGHYQVRSTLVDLQGMVIAENLVPFDIQALLKVIATVGTDKAIYSPDENVRITVEVANKSPNYILQGLSFILRVLEGDNEVFRDTQTIPFMLSGNLASLSSTWNTGSGKATTYTVYAEAVLDNKTVASAETRFMVAAVSELSGTVSASPKVAAVNGSMAIDYAVANHGNAEAVVELQILVLNGWDTVSSESRMVTIAVNGDATGRVVLPGNLNATGDYQVWLRAISQDGIQTLATDTFSVKDLLAPVVAIMSPLNGKIYKGAFKLSALVTDDASGIASAEYRFDARDWRPLPCVDPAAGRYNTRWMPLVAEEGTHTISMRATDKSGNTSSPVTAIFTIELLAPPNLPPIASAGVDRNVMTGEAFSLDGSASYDPEGKPITYLWSLIEKPVGSQALLPEPTSARPAFTPDVDGAYLFSLAVSDGTDTATDECLIIADTPNVAPNANAGADQNALVGAPVQLDGSQSGDPDNGPEPLNYSWSFGSKPAQSLLSNSDIVDHDRALASFVPDTSGIYEVWLSVNDGVAATVDPVMINAAHRNVPPNADAGADSTIHLGEMALLDGSASNDPDNSPGPLAYAWRFVSVPAGSVLTNSGLISADTAHASFMPDRIGSYVVELGVSDLEAWIFDNVAIMVAPGQTIFNLAARAKLDKVALSWTPVNGAQCYNVYRSVAGAAYNLLVSCHSTDYATYLDQNNIKVGTTYRYKVRSVANGLESLDSNVASVTPTNR